MRTKQIARILACVTLTVASSSALAVSGGTAAMPTGVDTTHYDPASFFSLFGTSYTVVADSLLGGTPAPAGYTPIANLTSSFASPDSLFFGEVRSQVWAGPVDTLLFGYQVEVDPSSTALSNGYLGGWNNFDIVDAGVFDSPQQASLQVRPIALTRTANSLGHSTSLSFGGGLVSTWFYFESDADTYQIGYANLIGLGAKVAGGIETLTPRQGLEPPHMPEPLTLIGVGLGVAAVASRLRRRKTC